MAGIAFRAKMLFSVASSQLEARKGCISQYEFSLPLSPLLRCHSSSFAVGRFVSAHVSLRFALRCACIAFCVGGSSTCMHAVGWFGCPSCSSPCASGLFFFLSPSPFSSFCLSLSSLPRPVARTLPSRLCSARILLMH